MSKDIHIAYIISNISNSSSFLWVAQGLNTGRFNLSFIFLNPSGTRLEDEIRNLGIRVYRILFRGKRDYVSAWLNCYRLLRKVRPDVVHCHLLDANLIGLSTAKAAGIRKRIHTRHHGDIHHAYFPRGVLLDRLVNRLSTDVIAPSEIARKVLVEMDKIQPSKVRVIHHGFDLSEFKNITSERVKNLRVKYKIPDDAWPVVGIIARWTEWKGVHVAIRAFIEFSKQQPNALLVLANAVGDYKNEINKLLIRLPEESYRIILFEDDVAALYRLFDIYVHVPIRETAEAFGQTYIESILVGLPSIFTMSGIAKEIRLEGQLKKVKFLDSSDIVKELTLFIKVHNKFSTNQEDVQEAFRVDRMITKLSSLYTE